MPRPRLPRHAGALVSPPAAPPLRQVDLRRFKHLASGSQAGGSRMYLLLARHLVESIFSMEHDDARLNAISNDKTARVGGGEGPGRLLARLGGAGRGPLAACCWTRSRLPTSAHAAAAAPQVLGRTGAGDDLPQLLQELGDKHRVKMDLSALRSASASQQQEEQESEEGGKEEGEESEGGEEEEDEESEEVPPANGAAKTSTRPPRPPLRPTPNTAPAAPRGKAERPPAGLQHRRSSGGSSGSDGEEGEQQQEDLVQPGGGQREDLVQLANSPPPDPLGELEDLEDPQEQEQGDIFIDYIEIDD
jgi:hypothetical protein